MSKDLFVGIQAGPHSLVDEGIDRALDLMQETAAINAVLVYSQTYYNTGDRHPDALAPDHGIVQRDERTRPLARLWAKPHAQYYRGGLIQLPDEKGREHADRDLFAELREPCTRRGIKLYARVLEAWGSKIAPFVAGFPQVLTVDAWGRIAEFCCWANPDYRAFWLSNVEDMFKSYDLDGLQFGSERVGPLSNVLLRGRAPTCFCAHCLARARDRGIDADRARAGFVELDRMARGFEAGAPRPADGVIVSFLRALMRWPEVLQWERLQYEVKEEVVRMLYGLVKLLKPKAQFGSHVDHQQSTYDPIWRANMDYREMTSYNDFIKPILYHDITGPRVRHWHLGRLHRTLAGELSLEQMLGIFYAVRGYDPAVEPGLDDMDSKGFSPDYVYRETRRLLADVDGRCAVYPGIGFDIPWEGHHFPSPPEKVYEATVKALEAGATGVMASREYGEMRVANLRAFGRAVREAQK